MSSDREPLWLRDIVENIDRANAHVGTMSFKEFEQDSKTIDAVERCIERIAEAAVRVGPERMTIIAPDLSVRDVRGMGNALRHSYDLIDLSTIWNTVTEEFPSLRALCLPHAAPLRG